MEEDDDDFYGGGAEEAQEMDVEAEDAPAEKMEEGESGSEEESDSDDVHIPLLIARRNTLLTFSCRTCNSH
jgi:hypothetical protein